jgi:hypothetical protein
MEVKDKGEAEEIRFGTVKYLFCSVCRVDLNDE